MSAAADLDGGDVWMLAQMSLDEDGHNESEIKNKADLPGDPTNEFERPGLQRARSSSLPHPPKSIWNSWLSYAPLQTYRYKPLMNKGDFRLLSVVKSDADDYLYFQLTRQRMDDCPTYRAISYTWGSTERTERIFHAITGELLFITKNCASALRNLRLSNQDRIWLDAICIDQDNIEERGHQVAMMADVFRNAIQTIAYVGEADEYSMFLSTKLRQHAAMHTAKVSKRQSYASSMIELNRQRWNCDDEDLHEPVRQFAGRPWFTRTWVIQEVLLSKDLHMQAGDDFIDFSELCVLLQKVAKRSNKPVPGISQTIRRYGSEDQVQTRLLKHFASPAPFSTAPAKGYLKYWQLFDLLFETTVYQCRDPRDKLFALTSLFDGDTPGELIPDYSLDTGEVYANITRWFIFSENITLALSAAIGVQSRTGIPSWCIDWRERPSLKDLARTNMGDRTQYSAGFTNQRSSHGHDHVPVLASTGKELRLRGIRVATIGGFERHTSARCQGSFVTLIPASDIFELPRHRKNWHFPNTIRPNNVVVVFVGFEVPFVLQPSADRWLLVGECDVEEIMYGQALAGFSITLESVDAENPLSPLEDFCLI